MDKNDDPYEVLEREMKVGEHHAEMLAHHMMRMGNAAKGTIPVEIDGFKFLVCIERVNT